MQYLTKGEVRRLFEVAYKHNKVHHLILVTGFYHGLRISETLGIQGKDVSDGQLFVQRLKRSKATLQPIHKDNDPVFDCTMLEELAKQTDGKLFNISRQRVDQLIKKYGTEAGIHINKLHSHAVCKHSIAMALFDKTQNISVVKSLLGHKSAGSTMCYLVAKDEEAAQKALENLIIA